MIYSRKWFFKLIHKSSNKSLGVDGKNTRNPCFYYFILATTAKPKGFLFLFVYIYLMIRVHLAQLGRPNIKLIFPNDIIFLQTFLKTTGDI